MSGDAINKAVWSLEKSDIATAQSVIEGDDDLDELTERVEENCMSFAARYQPLGQDLRTVISIMHIAINLERIGDYGVNIARAAVAPDRGPAFPARRPGRRRSCGANEMSDLKKNAIVDPLEFVHLQFENAKFIRINNYEPEQLIVLGNDKWMVFPFYKKNSESLGGTGISDHTGTFGWVIRYDGP